MFLSWGFTFILVVFSEISPLFDLWSKLVGQVSQPSLTSRTPIQLTTQLRISLLGLAESCVYLKGKAKYLKGTPIQISGAPFLCSFPLHITVHHKFWITQQPPQLSKSAVFWGFCPVLLAALRQKARALIWCASLFSESPPFLGCLLPSVSRHLLRIFCPVLLLFMLEGLG